jgi:hypothetical protein
VNQPEGPWRGLPGVRMRVLFVTGSSECCNVGLTRDHGVALARPAMQSPELCVGALFLSLYNFYYFVIKCFLLQPLCRRPHRGQFVVRSAEHFLLA